MAETKSAQQDDIDPRHRMAQRYLNAARAELEAKEAEQPSGHRRRSPAEPGKPSLSELRPSLSSSALLHGFLLMLVVTAAALSLTLCYLLLDTVFIAGRAIALPVGVVVFIALAYASALYLGIIESTSHGHTDPEDALAGDWRDWFWTMPASWGVLLATAGLGWLISRVDIDHTVTIIGATIWLGYPILQLSTLETGSIASPISLPVLRTLATRPLIWMLLFASSYAMWRIITWLAIATWRDPPFWTMLWMGPVVTVAVLIYAWLLGQLARWLTVGGR